MVPGLVFRPSQPSMMVEPIAAALFIGMWITMMIAMMFPSVSPMVVSFWRISKAKTQNPIASPVFLAGYLVVWALVGIVAYIGYRGVLSFLPAIDSKTRLLLVGGTFVLAGAYQFSKYKSVCLRHCRGPIEFVLEFKPGISGAARMGSEHGLYCLGCCWGLMVVLFVLGLMNLSWMGLIAAVIFVEKVLPFGEKMARVVGFGLMAAGLVSVIAALAAPIS